MYILFEISFFFFFSFSQGYRAENNLLSWLCVDDRCHYISAIFRKDTFWSMDITTDHIPDFFLVVRFIFLILGKLWSSASQGNCLRTAGGIQKDVVVEQALSCPCSDQLGRAGHHPSLRSGEVPWCTLGLWHPAEPSVTCWLHCP